MKKHRLWMRTLLVGGGGGLIAGLLLLSGGIARASDYVSVSAQTPADVVAIEEDGGTFTVVCLRATTVLVSAKPGYVLTSGKNQALSSSQDGGWSVVSTSSPEDEASGEILYEPPSCVFSAAAALNVYVEDAFIVTARVTPSQYGKSVGYTFDRGEIQRVSEDGEGVYELLVSTDSVGTGVLKAVYGSTVIASTQVRVITGTWKGSATWKYAGVNSGWLAPPEGRGTLSARGGSQMINVDDGGPHAVPVGSDCKAMLTFDALLDGQSLPGAYNHPFDPSYGAGMVKMNQSSQSTVFDYFAIGRIFVEDSSTIDLPPNVRYYWGDLPENTTVFQIRFTETFAGVGVGEFHVWGEDSTDFPIGNDIYYWPGASITLTVEPTSGSGFPPDVPGGGWGKENPKWWETGKDTSLGLPYDLGCSTLTVSAPNDGEVFGFAVSCGDSRKAARFRPVDVESVTVSCSHGRGGSNYLEVVSPDTVSYAMTWNCESAIGTPIPPVWSASPALPLLSGNPGEVVSQSLLPVIGSAPVTYTATCSDKPATVACYPLDKKVVDITGAAGPIEDFINNKLSSLVNNVTFTGPRGGGSFEIYNKEQADTLYVGRPWSLDVGFTPLFGVEWSDHLLSTHPLMLALHAIGLEAGPFIALSGSVSATVTGLGRDEYGILHAATANTIEGSLDLAIGAEVRSEDSGTFRLAMEATTGITLTGAFTVNPDIPSVSLDNCVLDIGGLDVNAVCEVNLEGYGWRVNVDISKSWTILEPSSDEIGQISLL